MSKPSKISIFEILILVSFVLYFGLSFIIRG